MSQEAIASVLTMGFGRCGVELEEKEGLRDFFLPGCPVQVLEPGDLPVCGRDSLFSCGWGVFLGLPAGVRVDDWAAEPAIDPQLTRN